MSYKVQDAVWERADHRGETMMVLLALAGYASSEGICWPAQDTLAKRARVSRRGLQYIIRRLVEAGDIEIEQAGGSGEHGRSSTVYRLSRYTGAPDAPLGSEDRRMACAPQAHVVRPTGEVDAPLPAHGMRPNLSSESVNESVTESASGNFQKVGGDEEALRLKISKAVGRDPQIHWNDNEVRLLGELCAMSIPPKSIDTLVEYYRANIVGNDYRRQTVRALLENFMDELDKSQAWKRKMRNFTI